MNAPKVSVLTALYNHERFLRERFRSIQEQTFTDWEWILVDDCSPDGSYALACELAKNDLRIRVERNTENLGAMATVQRAFSLSCGVIIYSCASDDSNTPTYLKEAVQAFDKHPNLGIFSSGSAYLDEKNRTWNGIRRPADGYFKGIDFIEDMLTTASTILNGPSTAFRRTVYEKAGGHCPNPEIKLNGFEDGYLYLRLCLFGDVLRLPKRLSYYRQHSNNLSKIAFQQPDAQRECYIRFKALDLFYEMADTHLIALPVSKEDAYQAAADFIWVALVRCLKRMGHLDYASEVEAEIKRYIPGFVPSKFAVRRLQEIKALLRKQAYTLHYVLTRRELRRS